MAAASTATVLGMILICFEPKVTSCSFCRSSLKLLEGFGNDLEAS